MLNTPDEVPSLDAVAPTYPTELSSLKSSIVNRLRLECANSLMGPWTIPENVIIDEVAGGLSNYLYSGRLKDDVPRDSSVPDKVLIRVYGELLRSNMDTVVLDAVIFALLSEKRLGPNIYAVFKGGRIEEFVESRTLLFTELDCSPVLECLALHMAVLHSLTMPLQKLPTFIFKTMAKFIQQLTGTRELSRSHRLMIGKSNDEDLSDDTLCSPTHSLIASSLFGSTSSMCSPSEPKSHLFAFLNEWSFVEEFEWLRLTFFRNLHRFPVRFCHNDFQENNLLVYCDPLVNGYRLLPIDYEYCCYNFRGFDVGNFFNEFCFDNRYPDSPGYAYYPDRFPARDVQLKFWRKYLTVYQYVLKRPALPGTYLPTRRVTQTSNLDPTGLSISDTLPNLNGSSSSNGVSTQGGLLHLLELDEVEDVQLVELDKETEDELILETKFGALLSHLWWASWSLIQSEISSIEFGFIDYAITRMRAYFELKNTLPKSELINSDKLVLEDTTVFPVGDCTASPIFKPSPLDDHHLY